MPTDRLSSARLVTTLLLALTSAFAVVGCGGARPTGFFPLTYWCGPPAEDARYKEVAECGFNLAFNGDPNLAHKYGMKVLVADPRVLAAVAKPGSETAPGLDAAVKDLAGHAAFWGFYLKDEPSAAKFADLAYVNQYLLAKAPKCVPYMNLFPTYASPEQLGTRTYEEHVERFMTEVKPKVLSYDHYALMEGGKERPDYFQNMEIIRSAGLRHDVPYWFIFLITPHFSYRDPSEGDLRWQIYTALAYGYKGLVYFTYWGVNDKRFGEAIIARSGQRTSRYWLASKLNSEVNMLGPILAMLRSTNVYHTAEKPPEGTRGPGPEAMVQSVDGGNLVVGELVDPNGRHYLFLANASPHEGAALEITLAEGVRVKEELPRGPLEPDRVTLQDRPPHMMLNLAAGDGRLFEVRDERKKPENR
ncbi:MAG: hypothetical protein JXQ73_02245 [Phycisphaerae bacterium]|nr:hypothetical protein [Phycisphaerae bacterium]